MDKFLKKKVYHYSHTFIIKDSLDRVFDVLRIPEFSEQSFKKYNLKIKRLTGINDTLDKIGSEFNISLNNIVLADQITEDSKNEENFKYFQIRTTKIYSFPFKYIMRVSLFWCTLSNQTIILEEMVGMSNDDYSKEFEIIKQQNTLKYQCIDEFLKQFTFNLTQFESIIINKDFDTVVNSVQNWEAFIKFSPTVGDKVQLEEDGKKINSCITLFQGKEKSILKIVKNEGDNGKKYYDLLLLNHKEIKAPKQYLKFVFIKVNEENTFLGFIHEFIEPIKYTSIMKMSKSKKDILSQFKKNLEK